MKYLFSFLLLSQTWLLAGQDFEQLFYGNRPNTDLPYSLLTKVQSLDDFIARYNGYHNAYGFEVNQASDLFKSIHKDALLWQQYRYQIIGGLIDSTYYAQHPNKVEAFAKAASKSKALNYYSKDWYATVPFYGQYKGKTLKGTLSLNIWYDAQKRSKWQIKDCHFDSPVHIAQLEPILADICQHIYLAPTSHENDFIALRKLLKKGQDLENHIAAPTKGLSILKYLMEKENYQPNFHNYYFHFQASTQVGFVVDKQLKIIDIQ